MHAMPPLWSLDLHRLERGLITSPDGVNRVARPPLRSNRRLPAIRPSGNFETFARHTPDCGDVVDMSV
jgi:hypothetical protein